MLIFLRMEKDVSVRLSVNPQKARSKVVLKAHFCLYLSCIANACFHSEKPICATMVFIVRCIEVGLIMSPGDEFQKLLYVMVGSADFACIVRSSGSINIYKLWCTHVTLLVMCMLYINCHAPFFERIFFGKSPKAYFGFSYLPYYIILE